MNDEVIEVIVHGTPVAKGRPRFNTKTGRTYTDTKTATYENLVRLAFVEKYPDFKPLEGALTLSVMACFPIPVSWSKKRRERAQNNRIYKTSRPDADNLVKSVCDGLNGVLWLDDAQIVNLHVYKMYSTYPRTEITVWEEDESNE